MACFFLRFDLICLLVVSCITWLLDDVNPMKLLLLEDIWGDVSRQHVKVHKEYAPTYLVFCLIKYTHKGRSTHVW